MLLLFGSLMVGAILIHRLPDRVAWVARLVAGIGLLLLSASATESHILPRLVVASCGLGALFVAVRSRPSGVPDHFEEAGRDGRRPAP
jgi:hypothetical protein